MAGPYARVAAVGVWWLCFNRPTFPNQQRDDKRGCVVRRAMISSRSDTQKAPPKIWPCRRNDVGFLCHWLSLSLAAGAGQDIKTKGREPMLRLIAVAFALTFASSALALPPVSVQKAETLVLPIRQACGAGMHYVNGVCLRTPARRAASRCVRGKTC
jgi:hypothetical protein